jgi:hypothetical protein
MESFGARIEHDYSQSTVVSNFFVFSRLSYETLDSTDSETLQSFLETYERHFIEKITVDTRTNKVSVLHNPLLISAADLSKVITTKTGIKTVVDMDGNEEKTWNFQNIEGDEEVALDTFSSKLRPNVILSGVFWVISMLSYIGGNW